MDEVQSSEPETVTVQAAPAAPAAPAPAPLDVPVVDTPQEQGYSFPETGNAGLDFALGRAAAWGITTESPSFQAAINGDFSLLEMELAANPDAHGHAQLIAFAKQAFQDEVSRIAQEEEAREYAVQEAVYGAAGSEESYQEVADWIRGNAEPEEKAVFNDLLGRGDPAYGVVAFLAMQSLYNSTAQKPAVDPIRPTAPATTGGDGYLSPEQYQREYVQLVKQLGAQGAQQSHQLQNLRARLRT